MSYLITYLEKSGAIRSVLTVSQDKISRVRLHFLADHPAAQEILLCELVSH